MPAGHPGAEAAGAEVRTSGVTRASNSPTITLAFLTGAPVEALTTVPTSVPLRASDAWSNAGLRVGVVTGGRRGGGAGAAVGEDASRSVSVLSPW